jgi:hypothetical protein
LPSAAGAGGAGAGKTDSSTGGAIVMALSPLERRRREFSARIFGIVAGGRYSSSTEGSAVAASSRVRDAVMSAANNATCSANTARRVT